LRKGQEKSRREGRGADRRGEPERRFLNLKGETASFALLRCMMQLEELPAGGVLEVLVGDAQASVDLARFLSEEGHKVVEVARARPGVWRLDIEKGNE
jgi:TusA-related sulfurtransferase